MIRALAALVILVTSAPAIAAETPKGFVAALYRAYATPDADPLGNGANRVFTPSLLVLIRADRTPNGEIGKLDYDPVCGCQDTDGLKLLNVTIRPISPTAVHAVNTLKISATTTVVDLTLLKTAAGWRVDDAKANGAASLRNLLGTGRHKRQRGS